VTAKDVTIPAGLLAATVILYAVYGLVAEDSGGITSALLALLIMAVVGVPLGIVACFIVARLLDIGFGDLWTAALKLAAIFLFPSAVALFLPPGLAWLVATGLYLLLLLWLLELEGMVELAVCVIVIALVRLVALFVLASLASQASP
jgi:hypothetical protein